MRDGLPVTLLSGPWVSSHWPAARAVSTLSQQCANSTYLQELRTDGCLRADGSAFLLSERIELRKDTIPPAPSNGILFFNQRQQLLDLCGGVIGTPQSPSALLCL